MGKTILGKIYIGDNENVLFAIDNGVSQIILMNGECDSKVILSDSGAEKKLNFNEHHQIYGIYRLRSGCEKTIYFTDNYNPPRYLDISDVNSFKEMVYNSVQNMVEYGPVDADKLLLQKVYDKIPEIDIKIDGNGKLLSGSYNFAVRYVDADLNPSEWIYTTEPVMIWQSNSSNYSETRASSNEDVEYRKYGPTDKSIKVSVTNSKCDHSYMFVQFAMICATQGTGEVNDVVYSQLVELDFNKTGNEYDDTELSFLFTGKSNITTGSEEEILANTEIYDRVKCIEQADNRLVMGNITDMDVDWCKLQKYASRIVSDCVFKEADMSDCNDKCNSKNAMTLYNNGVGYQPGEIYSFGIVYVFENGAKSPVYHIPGRSSDDDGKLLCGGDYPMQATNNKCSTSRYSTVSMACDGFQYWGVDNRGTALEGTQIRHHRFPYRGYGRGLDTEPSSTYRTIMHYNLIVGILKGSSIRSRFRNNFDEILVKYNVDKYDDNGLVDSEEFEINMPYKDNFFTTIYSKLDVSRHQTTDLIDWNASPQLNNEWYLVYKHDSVIDSKKNNQDTCGYNNRRCSNPESTTFLKKHKQHRYVDIYSYESTNNERAYLSHLQEYPQFRENNSDISSRPVFMTTGSVIVYKNYASPPGIIDNDKRERLHDLISSDMESLEDDWFSDMVKALPKNTTGNIFNNGRRVRLRYTEKERDIIDQEDGNDNRNLGLWTKMDDGCLMQVYINTSIGFYIEPRKEIMQTYVSSDKIDIMGIRFGNIDIPDEKYLNGHKVIGYQIVQNERTDDDMTILDSAILTPLFCDNDQNHEVHNGSVVSGRIFADDTTFSTVSDIEVYGANLVDYLYYEQNKTQSNISLVRNNLFAHGVGFINPRFKFNKTEFYDFRFRLLGYYSPQNDMIRCSTDINELWITEDVQAGSSYNKKINKSRDKDDDGFDLHVYHKNVVTKYNEYVPLEQYGFNDIFEFDKKDIHYLSPTSYIDKKISDIDTRTLFNASGDNTMGFIFNPKCGGSNVDMHELFCGTGKINNKINRLPYGYMERDLDEYYPDFVNRPYFAASDIIFFNLENVEDNSLNNAKKNVFRGDCFVSPMKYTSSMLYDVRMKKRGKKATWWMYLAGSLGAVGGIVGSVWTGGATMAVVGPSISLIQNGIRTDVAYNNMKKFKDLSANDALKDKWVSVFVDNDKHADDEIQWLCESVDGLFFESKINMGWRVGTTISDITDYLNPLSGYNSSELRQYFQKKLTYADKDNKDGRMYRGFALAEIYDINKDFQRRNRQKMFYTIPVTHKCCSECENKFPKRIVYSQQSFSEERTDNYKVFLTGNYVDVDGETGDITNISYNGQDAFMVFTEEGLWQLVPQRQQQSNPVTQVVSFIGTGNFFAASPQRITKNDTNVSFGSRHQGSFINTPEGLFWYSEHDNAVYTFSKNMPVDIFRQSGMSKWFERNGRLSTDIEWYKQFRTQFPFKDNVSSDIGTGYVLGWDNKYGRLLITKKDNRCSFNSECFYDADERQKELLMQRISQIRNAGGYNVCYKWSKERCCYVIDYETNTTDSVLLKLVSNNSSVSDKTKNTVIYVGDVEYYNDEGKKSECGITDIVASMISDIATDGIIVVSSNAIFEKIQNSCSADLTHVTYNGDIYGFLSLDLSQYLDTETDNLTYIAILSDFPSFTVSNNSNAVNKIISLSQGYRNFNMSVFPILQREYDTFDYQTLSSYLTYKQMTINDYDDNLITDEFCYVTDKIVAGEEREYSNNVSEYLSILSDVKEQINDIIEYVSGDDFDVDMFDSLTDLVVLFNTYNYWNLMKHSFNFTTYDPFDNGNRNLMMFKGVSEEFDAFVLNSGGGTTWYDSDYDNVVAEWNKLVTDPYYLTSSVNGVADTTDVANYVGNLYDKLYAKYMNHKKNMVYGGDNYTTMKNLTAMLSVNSSSPAIITGGENISDEEYDNILLYLKANLPVGTKSTLPVYIDTDIYIDDFHKNNIINNLSSDYLSNSVSKHQDDYVSVEKSYTKTTSAYNKVTHEEHREYLGNHDPLYDDMEKTGDNSFTISYKPGLGFVSFHSYMPSMYISTPDDIWSWRVGDDNVYKHNIKGDYQRFYGEYYPFMIEMVDKNQNILYGPQISDNVSVIARADEYNGDDFTERRNVFFNKVYFYNSRQCSLFNDILVKGDFDDNSYFSQYMNRNANQIAAEKRDSYWHINEIYDYRTDYDIPIHSEDMEKREEFMENNNMNGWIDKSFNEDIANADKNWMQVEPMKDIYICGRWFYNPAEESNVRLTVQLNTNTKTQVIDNTLK